VTVTFNLSASYSVTACNATHRMAVVILSVCLSILVTGACIQYLNLFIQDSRKGNNSWTDRCNPLWVGHITVKVMHRSSTSVV